MKLQALLLLLLGLLVGLSAQAEDDDQVNYLDVAALMLRDGNLNRAELALNNLDVTELESAVAEITEDMKDKQRHAIAQARADLGRYWVLRGTIWQRQGQLESARDAITKAIASGRKEAALFLSLAQINFSLQDYQAAIAAVQHAGPAVDRIGSVYHLKAQANWLLGNQVLALAILDQASQIFVDDRSFTRRKVFYLIELKLYQQAAELGRSYLRTGAATVDDYIGIGNALRQSGAVAEALGFLELAHLQFPDNTDVSKVLAHSYIDQGKLHAAADIIYQAALRDNSLMAEASELYRRAGQVYRALTLNSEISNQETKLKQRLALYIQLLRFAQAAAMENDLQRLGLLANEDIRYALAYALFKTGDFAAAEQHLSLLTRSDLFRKAIEVRRAMQDCADDRWKCA
ncbi:MAG: hypothetical protein PF630_01635 [Gammaproteobacteria bacterium]|nr:hypothetical protein [Gammaproteobacteria bacterium]